MTQTIGWKQTINTITHSFDYNLNICSVSIYIEFNNYSECLISFINHLGESIEILSTNNGIINTNNEIAIQNSDGFVNCKIFVPTAGKIECITSIFEDGKLKHYETIPISIAVPGSIKNKTHANKNEIATKNNQSGWVAEVEVKDDIFIKFLSKNNNPCVMCFGPESPDVTIYDFVFPVDSVTRSLYIPTNAIPKQKTSGQTMRLFEILPINNSKLKNAKRKVPISNQVKI